MNSPIKRGNMVIVIVSLIIVAAYMVVNRYEIVAAGAGEGGADYSQVRGFRLDKWTGDVCMYQQRGRHLSTLTEEEPKTTSRE